MPTATSSAKLNPTPKQSIGAPIAAIIGVSVVATLFLFWLIYVHPASDAAAQRFTFLPNLNALLNGLAAIALVAGYYFVRTQRIAAHRASMFTAFAFSSLFLVCYIANHALHGDTLYPVHDATYRYAYIPILVSHIVLATLALPIVLITFFLSLSGRIAMHRKVARVTFPLWLYVSITGVVVRVMLVAALR
jgi:putative membrane protein